MGKVICSTACFIRWHGKILLAKRNSKHFNGYHGCPGGKVDFGESPVEAIIREVKEETGLDVKNTEPINYVISHIKGDDQYICFWFLTTPDKPSNWNGDISFIETNKEGEPKTEKWKFYDEKDFNKLKLMPSTMKAYNHMSLPIAGIMVIEKIDG